MKKNLYWLLLTTVFMLTVAMAGVGRASPAPVIRVEPKDNTAEAGETFAVNITVTGISEEESLYSWECRITFNPNIIEAADATEGPFLEDTGYDTAWLTPRIDNATGTIDIGAIIPPSIEWQGFPPNGAVGSGTLATVTFKVISQGATDLEFKECAQPHLYGDTELYTVIFAAGPPGTSSPIDHTAEKGFFSNAGPPIPILLIAGIIVVVAVSIVAVLYFRRKRM